MAARVPDMFCSCCEVKNGSNIKTTETRGKNIIKFGIVKILEMFWCRFE
jgi:hypothetical protein